MGGSGNLFEGFREKARLSKRTPKDQLRQEKSFQKQYQQQRSKQKKGDTNEQAKTD
jgi:hypothetical protein